jgi:4'-phosphopantetheinyl transferase
MRLLSFPKCGRTEVWITKFDPDTAQVLEPTLNSTERAHWRKLHFEKHQFRYIFAHGVLRTILSGYVGVRPNTIRFSANSFGKPYIDMPESDPRISFNMSHAEDLTIVAVMLAQAVGVDVESVRPIPELDNIARDYFSDAERALLQSSPAGLKEQTFCLCWTRKEAYVKAVGKGLSIPLNSFDTSMHPVAKGRFLNSTEHAPQIESWWLSDLTLPYGYVGALVVEGVEPKIDYRNWNQIFGRIAPSGGTHGGKCVSPECRL